MKRRRFALSAAVTLVGTAGCLGMAKPSTSTISAIDIWNQRPSRQRVTVRVKDADEVVYEVTEEMEPYDVKTGASDVVELKPGWPDEPGAYLVEARLAQQTEWQRRDLSPEGAPACARVTVSVDPDGLFLYRGFHCEE